MPQSPSNEENAAIARREAARRLQQDLELSLGQTKSLPDLLMRAPLAINLLGQIKLLAFSDHALAIPLHPPIGGFKYLRYPSLSSAMIQIVHQSSKAFEKATRNMRAIKLQAKIMFGPTGRVNAILMHLQDPRVARVKLLASMTKFQTEMQQCADYAREIQAEFDAVVDCAEEASEGMADQANAAARREEKLKEKRREVLRDQAIQANLVSDLESRVKNETEEYAAARKQYDKVVNKGELSALAIGTVEDIKNTALGAINATIGVVRSVPKVAVETVRAFNGIKGDSMSDGTGSDAESSALVEAMRLKMSIDPALLAAEAMEGQIGILHDLLQKDATAILRNGQDELRFCLKQLESLQRSVGDFASKHAVKARRFLSGSIAVIEAILSIADKHPNSAEGVPAVPDHQVALWRKTIEVQLAEATKLRAYAASQPGYGFGSTMDIPATKGSSSSRSDSGYNQVLKRRYEKCMITRAAAQDAKDNLTKSLNMQLAAQAKVIELNHAMKNLEHQNATIAQTKEILRKSIGAMTALQAEVAQLADFFNHLANIVSVSGIAHAKQYIETIEDGFEPKGANPDVFKIAYSRAQAEIIRETVILLRGHFRFVVKSADLYEEVASQHINPCIRMASRLPLSATISEQNEAKAVLEQATNDSAEAIRLLAQKQIESYHSDLDKRIEEIETDLKELPQLENLSLIEEAVKEGVKEASEEMMADAEEKGAFFDETVDDDF